MLSDLEFLLAAEDNGLEHFVWRDVRLEVARIPQFADQFTKSLNENDVVIARWPFDGDVIFFSEEIVTKRDNVRECL